ncbi:MAG: orotidine 5'-phosphate decarboxylase [Chrysothrix sp. TS-e1954]|nr:MAG: orotidine 5'-phosphate decarboxylase [Chrysothrix sp. TS-e1954]
MHSTYLMSYQERANLRQTPPLTSYLLRLMAAKQTNLCLSADVQSTSQLLDIAEECGSSICMLKTHADIVHDFGEKTMKGLMEIASRKKFLLFEDRKFGDIGNTVQTQYAAGTHRIASWASLVNAHIFPGPAIVTSLKSAAMSSLASNNSRISTEITGGASLPLEDGAPGYFLHKTNSARSSSKFSSTASSDGDAETTRGDLNEDDEDDTTPSADQFWGDQRPSDQDGRKGSIVSVSTTISSSTEYISPPSASPAETPAAINGMPTQAPLARGLLLLAQMSSKDHMLGPEYTQKCLEIARDHRDFVIGFIAQESLNSNAEDNFVVLTPGISLPPESTQPSPATTPGGMTGLQQRQKAAASAAAAAAATTTSMSPQQERTSSEQPQLDSVSKTDGKGQQYNTPRHALSMGSDVIIVGRGIIAADDRGLAAERYRNEGWSAYLSRVGAGAGSARSKKGTANTVKASGLETGIGLVSQRTRPGQS